MHSASGSLFIFILYQGTSLASYPNYQLGRFRLSVTSDDSELIDLARKVQEFQDFHAQLKELGAVSLSRTLQCNRNDSVNASGSRGHDDDAIAHVNCFVDVMGHQEDRGAAR